MTLHPGDLDFTDPDLFVEHAGPPHEYLAMLRREAPVSWNPPPAVHKSQTARSRTGFWVLAKHVEDLACELPLTLLCELVGVPYEDRKKIFDWSNQLVGADDPDMHPAESTPLEAAAQMYVYCNQLAAQKREQPDDTLISKYVNGEVDGHKLSEMEINQFFVLLSVAGNETTRNATTSPSASASTFVWAQIWRVCSCAAFSASC